MHTELQLTTEPIDEQRLAASRGLHGESGAVITFLGVVRGVEGGQRIGGLDYEAFELMARHQFEQIFLAAAERWPIDSLRLVHRLGPVRVNEPSLWVEVIAPHRGEAFAACQFVIDEMKRLVPIWKRVIPS